MLWLLTVVGDHIMSMCWLKLDLLVDVVIDL